MKFRIWNTENKAMYYATMAQLCAGEQWQFRHTLLLSQGVLSIWSGLVASDGNDVYEGDIISNGIVTYAIEFFSGAFWATTKGEQGGLATYRLVAHCKVIGNIYENQELLTK